MLVGPRLEVGAVQTLIPWRGAAEEYPGDLSEGLKTKDKVLNGPMSAEKAALNLVKIPLTMGICCFMWRYTAISGPAIKVWPSCLASRRQPSMCAHAMTDKL